MASYHEESDTLSTTQFKLYCASPVEYKSTFVDRTLPPKSSTNATETGTVVHAILLEKKHIDEVVRAYPSNAFKSNGHLNPGPANEFSEKIFPLIPMKQEQIDQVERICDRALKSELGPVLKSGATFEQRLDAEIEGVKCRCKPDIHTIIDGQLFIWDLKTTERIRPDDWWRTAKMMRYAIQDAFYSLVAGQVYGTKAIFRFWAIEVIGNHRVQPYWYDDRSREIAQSYVKEKLVEFAQRKAEDNWSDNWEPSGTIGPWDLGQSDAGNELVEFEG